MTAKSAAIFFTINVGLFDAYRRCLSGRKAAELPPRRFCDKGIQCQIRRCAPFLQNP